MEIIQSTQNDLVKFLKKLQKKKYRKEYNRFVVENAKIISDSLESGFLFESLFVTEIFWKKNQKFLENIQNNYGQIVQVVSEKVYNSFSSLVHPQGIAAVYIVPNDASLDYSKNIVYLQGVNDPGNLGTIFRSGVAFGFTQFVLDEFCVDLYNPKVIQSSKDAILKVKIQKDSGQKFLREIQGSVSIVALSQKGKRSLRDIFESSSCCFVFGSEAHGISEDVYKYVSEEITIPMLSNMESLNVGSAAAIVFYEIFR